MLFGKRYVNDDNTVIEDKPCPMCSGSVSRRLSTEYAVVFGFDLIPLHTQCETVCEACGHTDAPDETAQQLCADKHRAHKKTAFLKIAAILVVLAVVAVMAVVLTAPAAASPEQLKALVNEEGIYTIHNFDGDVLGIVQLQDDEKQLTFYEERSVLTGEPGTDGTFIKHSYLTEAISDGGESILVTNTSNPGILKDKHDMVVREYHYNMTSGKLGYMRGVEDLSAIMYTPGKAVYPFSYYTSGSDVPMSFTVVLHINDEQRLEAMFADDEHGALLSLTITDYESRRETAEKIYFFDADEIERAKQSGLSPESTLEDMLGFIEQQIAAPSIMASYTYYQDSHVFSSIDISMPDGMSNSQDFDVTQKGQFYLQKAKN